MLEQEGRRDIALPDGGDRGRPTRRRYTDWLLRFVATPPDDLILFTGEGLRRLARFRPALGSGTGASSRLDGTRARSPAAPSRCGRCASSDCRPACAPPSRRPMAHRPLSEHDFSGRRVGVQLYPGNPNEKLTDFLRQAGPRRIRYLPYVYVSAAEDERVVALIDRCRRRRRRHRLYQLATGPAVVRGRRGNRAGAVTAHRAAGGSNRRSRSGRCRGVAAAGVRSDDHSLSRLFHETVGFRISGRILAIALRFATQRHYVPKGKR